MLRFTFVKIALLVSALCLFCSTNLFAGKPVIVKSGSAAVLKTSSKAALEIDYSAAKVGKETIDEYLKRKGDDFVRDWPADQDKAYAYFKNSFNNKNKGMKIAMNESETTYKIVIRVKNLDMGNPASFLMPYASDKAGGVIMSGTVDIINLSTNETVCAIEVDEIQGVAHFSESNRLCLMFHELAMNICKLK